MASRSHGRSLAQVLVPIGGNGADTEALTLACEVARKSKAKVFAIHVIEVKRTLPLEAEVMPEVERGEEILSKAELLAEDLDYEIDTELLQAREVGPAIVDEAEQRGADLIIMGLPFKRRFGEFTLGRTIPFVLRHAGCQVWVCRDPEEPKSV